MRREDWWFVIVFTVALSACRLPEPTTSSVPVPGRLTVRPHEMATATQTAQAGEFSLDSLENYLVYVPPKCVGARRCPLLVFLHGAGQSASTVMPWQRPMADKYGIIVLAPTAAPSKAGDQWGISWKSHDKPDLVPKAVDQQNIDAAMKQVLRKFAIDPDRIALLGRCAGGPPSSILGGNNLDVFSRVLPVSAGYPPMTDVDPPNKTTEFFLDAGIWESGGNSRAFVELMVAGHTVKQIISLRGHGENLEDYDFVGSWLQTSWAIPDPAARPAPSVIAGPVPVLTTDVVNRMTAFWTSFMKEPDSIRETARQAYQREVAVPVGQIQPSVVMVDMAALAGKVPSVAAKLEAAGLTATQHDAYRVALVSASVTKDVGSAAGPIDATLPLWKNIAFLYAHPDELDALNATGVWATP